MSTGTKSGETTMTRAHSIAIVGLGPKGFYCLERLLAEAHARPLKHPLHIHVFNRSAHFGASPVYDPAQPEYILVNISVGEIDLWAADDPPIVAGRGLDFVCWYQKTFQPQTPLTGEEYLSRAVVGRYLIEGFERILAHLPRGVVVSCHVGEVSDVRPEGQSYSVEFMSEDGEAEQFRVEKVLLATGHSRLVPGDEDKRYHEFAGRHEGTAFIPFVYPVVEALARIPSSARVAMKGVGLTFIDAVLELTEGRGGRFELAADGSLAYTRSGKEPRAIFPYSRTGLPMTPKAHDLPIHARLLTFFTHEALAELRRNAPDGKLDFERDLWPLFELEMELHYYRVAMRDDTDAHRQLESCGDDAQAMRRVIDAYLRAHTDAPRFDYRPVLDPVGARRFEDAAEFDRFVGQYMEDEIARARKGHAGCGVKSAIDIWYEVRTVLGSVLQFGGLNPESHRKLIEHHYPRLKRVAFGPPIINIEKLLALQRARLLDFSVARNPRVLTDEDSGCFELRCDEISGAIARAEILVDATYPPANIPRDASPLYQNLQRRGMVRAYENRLMNGDNSAYRPGAIDMTEGERFVVGGEGTANEDIAVIGIPTEGNLVGNLTMGRDAYAGMWAAKVIGQLRQRELAR
ncbi:MAG TPA: FAD/NAD(P)-binding protein [Pyrinomonadaceae bacterium]|nr:FAD/NAD(P)-binding protein [Pyrinomonadaceae bacterium]